MTLSWFQLLTIVAVPIFLGAGLLSCLGVERRTDPLAFWAWCWLLGSMGMALLLSAWLWLAWPLESAILSPVALALAGILFVLGRLAPRASRPAPDGVSWDTWCFRLVLAFLLAVAVDRALISYREAIVDSDEALIWAARAKAFYSAGDFGPRFRTLMEAPRLVAHKDYPPLNPLLQVWTFAHAGKIVHVENRLPLQVFGVAFVLLVGSAVRRRASPLVAAAFLACLGLIAFARFSLTRAFSDHMIAFGFLASWDLWQRYEEDGQRVWLRMLGASAAFLVWSKSEGLLLILAAVMAVATARVLRRTRFPSGVDLAKVARWCLPTLASLGYLLWFNAHFGLQNDLLHGEAFEGSEPDEPQGLVARALLGDFERIRTIVAHFGGLMASHYTHHVALVFLALLALAPGRALARGRAALTLGLLLALLAYMAVYLGTHWEVQRHLDTSAHRLIHHLVPTMGLWVLLFIVEELPWARSAEARSPAVVGPLLAGSNARA